MTLRSYTHVALRVENLREAEAFYRELFALEVTFREAETSEDWQMLPPSADWQDAEPAGTFTEDGRLSHVGVFASEDQLQRLPVPTVMARISPRRGRSQPRLRASRCRR
jgi:catechol 2,3-dioxygenase-like lactoylglutathione lyase family enzyme